MHVSEYKYTKTLMGTSVMRLISASSHSPNEIVSWYAVVCMDAKTRIPCIFSQLKRFEYEADCTHQTVPFIPARWDVLHSTYWTMSILHKTISRQCKKQQSINQAKADLFILLNISPVSVQSAQYLLPYQFRLLNISPCISLFCLISPFASVHSAQYLLPYQLVKFCTYS